MATRVKRAVEVPTLPSPDEGVAARSREAGQLPALLEGFFERRGWKAWEFQRQAWGALAEGRSGLIHVPTGAGKTYAAYLGALGEMIQGRGTGHQARGTRKGGKAPTDGSVVSPSAQCAVPSAPCHGLSVLYLTPLRAVARDIEAALRLPVVDCGLGFRVESRTGDTGTSARSKQKERLPDVLVTTPESLSLMLTWADAAARFAGLRCVIVDEWHEMLSSKRGTQVELALARLRRLAPGMRTWALSATLANLEEAARAAVGWGSDGRGGVVEPVVISAKVPRPVEIETLLPEPVTAIPWAGHLGLTMLPRLVEWLDAARSTLIFVNTRSQCERWYHALLAVRPEWESIAAIHHGSIDRKDRERTEAGLKDGSIRMVVATSSLDLGVDFSPVERVVQIGSPKGVARLMQRAGRSGHRPGETCRVLCVPTHALEIVEVAAVRSAIAAGVVEGRVPERRAVDVLAQHMVTVGLGGGFDAEELFEEVRTTHAYREMTRVEFEWALSLVTEGGGTLRAYPEFRKVEKAEDGRWTVKPGRVAQMHRLNVGTIVSDATVDIAFMNGRRIGSIEENFVAGLRAGQRFFFAGRALEFVRMHEMSALVRPSRSRTSLTPIWSGTRLPISESMGGAMRAMVGRAGEIAGGEGEDGRHGLIGASRSEQRLVAPGNRSLGVVAQSRDHGTRDLTPDPPELIAAMPILATQARLSSLPAVGEILIELTRSREGRHAFVFPFEGRLVHAGLAAVLALRLGRLRKASITISANDYGFELLTEKGYPFEELLTPAVFHPAGAGADSVEALNLGELAKRQFREVARVSGLVPQMYPGLRKGARQVHATASLIYDVYREFDPDNPLMHQARREVLERQFEEGRLGRTMARLASERHVVVQVKRATPLSLPLMLERESGRLSTESLLERVRKIQESWGE